MVVLFFSVSVLNNYALNFNIPLPLHMIFRSVRALHVISMSLSIHSLFFFFFIKGSLITNMVLGIIYLKNKSVWDILITLL